MKIVCVVLFDKIPQVIGMFNLCMLLFYFFYSNFVLSLPLSRINYHKFKRKASQPKGEAFHIHHIHIVITDKLVSEKQEHEKK
jgi:hypothetical protein